MATKFQIKRTSVSGRTPNTTNSANTSYIAAGELALNLTDQKLYSSNGTVAFEVGANLTSLVVNSSLSIGNSTVNTVANSTSISTKQIYANGSIGASGTVLTSNGSGIYWAAPTVANTFAISSETFTANGTATQFTLSQETTSLETFVFLNGVAQIPTTDYSISSTTLTFVTPPANNDEVEVRIIDIPQINGIDIKLDSFVGNGSNTVYTLSTSLSSNTTTFVYLNGVAQVPTVDYGVSGSTLTFTTAPVNLELIRAVTINPVGNYASDSFTANSTVNNNFTLSIPTVTNRALVFINGVAQAPSIDYYVSGSTLSLTNNAAANDVVQVRSFFDEPSGSGANTTIQYNFSGRLKGSSGFTFNETTNNVTISNTLIVPNFILNASNPPSNSTSTGSTGTFAWDSSYFYIATGTNTWKKVPISTDGVVGSAITAGSNTEIQFNSSGALGANSNFKFDSAATLLTVGNSTVNTTVNSIAVTATKIIANGAFGSNGQVLTSNGTAMYWGTGGGGAGSGVGITRESFSGNGSNTIFTLSTEPIDETHLMVYVDRVIQRDADYSVSGTTLTFAVAPDNGAEIDAYIMTDATQQVKGVKVNTFTGNGSNTQFTLGSSSSNASYTLAFVDTVFQPTSEYTVAGNLLTFNTAPDNGVTIEVIQLGVGLVGDPQVAGSNNEIQYHSSNSFAANNKFTFNPTTTTLALGSNVTINTSAIFIGNSTVNTTIIAGNINLQGTQLQVGNVVVNGNQLVLGNVTITDTQITVGNSTSNIVLGQTGTLSGNGSQLTSVNAIALQGNSVSDILVAANTAANTLAAAAFTNAASRADSAYSNAVSYADSKAATAYSNATSYADTVAATAFTNAASRADSAYSNAASYADTKAGQAYSNAIAYSGNAVQAYNNAVSYAASNTYVNNTFLPLAGGTLTGALTINATANIVSNLAANNVVFRGDVQIDGNLVVSGTSITLNAASLAIEDNMIYLNNGSQVTHPDLGFAGNYNDGSYKHAGFFRDATDGVWKVYDGYTPEPDASAYIDTSNLTFRIADFTANVITANSFSGNGASITSVNAASVGGNTAATLRSYSDTVAATAFSNAAARADSAYSNAVAYAASNSYVNSTFLPLAGGTLTGTLTVKAISSNGSVGTAGQLLASNGTSTYWINPPASTNVDAQYTWTNNHTFNAALTVANTLTANGKLSITADAGNEQIVVSRATNTNEQLILGFHSSDYGSIQAIEQNVSYRPLIFNRDGGSVGIGTASFISTEKLLIKGTALGGTAGNISYNTTFWTPDTSNTTRLSILDYRVSNGTSHSSSRNLIQRRVDSTDMGFIGFDSNYTSIGWGTTVNAIFASNGNVGIGNTAPATLLRVEGGTISQYKAAGDNNGLLVSGGDANNSYVRLQNSFASVDYGQGAAAAFVNVNNNQPWYVSVSGASRLWIANTGNIGIGTTSPTSFGGTNLNINSPNNSTYASTLWVSNSYVLQALVNEASAVMSIGARSNHKLDLCTNDTTRVTIAANGNVGISNTSPSAKLDVYGGPIASGLQQLSIGDALSTTASLAATNWYRLATLTSSNAGAEVEIHVRIGNTHNNTVIKVSKGTGQWRAEVYRAGHYVDPGTISAYVGIDKVRVYDVGINNVTHIDIKIAGSTSSITYNVVALYNISTSDTRTTLVALTDQGTGTAGVEFQAIGTMASWGHSASGQSVRFTETGTISCVSLTETSSITFKENVNPISNALDNITKLVGVTYDRKDGSAKQKAGLIAEEVEQVLPNVVQKDNDGNPSGIHYTNLIAYLVESIKELKQEIDILKGK